ncbi:non-reducing end alpha-L-arabinofuranosidase family hydrolase [Micromonospora haikouensis]|uniref:non-reducing end alpha-L-arabinofuranosidase family hydrolase n=1 Tax=Micromonospora haikouensis TaxID=686309 RepID=UPI001F520158|nr:non-reducing end alpha-L-arabinofuranosidase family hydrolase [Micromonospora haikouensis]
MRTSARVRAGLVLAVAGLAASGTAAVLPARAAAAGCSVSYAVSSQWTGGFGANVTVTNLGDPVDGWSLTWSYGAGQQVTQAWNATVTQSGAQVVARNVGYNATIGTNASVSFGFNGSWSGGNPAPTSFTLNGTACTGGVTNPTTPPPTTAPPPTSAPPPTTPPPTTPPTQTLPSSFRWSSSGALVGPKNDGRGIAGIKDPSVVYHDGKYHVFASTAQSSGYNLVYFTFTDWSQAGSATFHYLDQSPIGTGYRAAPQVFYFAPQRLWYLVYQTGNASYSTNPDISNPNGWTAPKHFYSGMPQIIRDNIGDGYWVDMWVICDSANCHLFSSDDNGHLYRSQTSVANFPNGMSQPVIAMQDANKNRLFEASNVYRVGDRYLLLIEAIGGDGRRWFRSWTSTGIAGPWQALAAEENNPFARHNNVIFSGTAWSRDISHGELIRSGNDQTLPISPCNLRFLYQGLDPNAGGDYNSLPWRLGLITQTNSTC